MVKFSRLFNIRILAHSPASNLPNIIQIFPWVLFIFSLDGESVNLNTMCCNTSMFQFKVGFIHWTHGVVKETRWYTCIHFVIVPCASNQTCTVICFLFNFSWWMELWFPSLPSSTSSRVTTPAHIYIYICIWGALTLALEHLSSIGLGALPQGPSNQRPPLYVCYHLQYLNAAQNLGSKVGPVDVLVVRGGGHRSRT